MTTKKVSMENAETTEKWSTVWHSFPKSGDYPREMKSVYEKVIHNPIYATAQSRDMKTTQMPVETGMGKEMVIHLLYNILFSQKNEIPLFTTKWSQLGTIILSEIKQSKGYSYQMFSLMSQPMELCHKK